MKIKHYLPVLLSAVIFFAASLQVSAVGESDPPDEGENSVAALSVDADNEALLSIDSSQEETLYETLSGAVAAANVSSEPVTVRLLKDVDLTTLEDGDSLQIGGTSAITLDLNGCKITGQLFTQPTGLITLTGDGTLTKTDGTDPDGAPLRIVEGSQVCLNGVTIDGGNCAVKTSGTLNIKKAAISGTTYGIGFYGDCQATIGSAGDADSEITVTAGGQAIATAAATGNAGMQVTVYSGTFTTTDKVWSDCPVYWASHGTLTINGGSFQNTTADSEAAAVYQKNGTINISGGTFSARDAIKAGAEATDCTEIELNISGGTFNGRRSGLYFKTTASGSNCTKFEINITGGTFTGSTEGAIKSSVADTVVTPAAAVSGGIFNSQVDSSYCASGYTPATEADENGYYTVQPMPVKVQLTSGAEYYYSTLQGALDDSTINGGTILLLDNLTENVTHSTNRTIYLDLNGHTLTNSGDGSTITSSISSGNLYIKDSSNEQTGAIINTTDSYAAIEITNGNVRIYGGTISGGCYNIRTSSSSSSLYFYGGTLTDSKEAALCNEGKAYLYGGSVTADGWGIINTGSTMKISNDSSGVGIPSFNCQKGILSASGGTLTIYKGDFIVPEAVDLFDISGTAKLTVSGQYDPTFSKSFAEVYVADGYYLSEEPDESGKYYLKIREVATVTHADTSVTAYNSLDGAITAAKDGELVTLLEEVKTTKNISIGRSITLDLGGHTVIGTNGTATFTVNNYSTDIAVTIQNGTIENQSASSSGSSAVKATQRVNLILENVVLSGINTSDNSMGYGLLAGGNMTYNPTVTVRGESTRITGTAAGIAVLGYSSGTAETTKLIVEDGTITGGYYGIAGNGTDDNTSITISAGTISSTASDGAAIYHPQDGDLTITGGTLRGATGVQYCGTGTLSISGGTIQADGAAVSDPGANSQSVNDGSALSIISRGGGYGQANSADVTIAGGSFISKYGVGIREYCAGGAASLVKSMSITEAEGAVLTVAGGSGKEAVSLESLTGDAAKVISAGHFTTKPSSEYLTEGKTAILELLEKDGISYLYTIGETTLPELTITPGTPEISSGLTNTELADSFLEMAGNGTIGYELHAADIIAAANQIKADPKFEELYTEGLDGLKKLDGNDALTEEQVYLHMLPYIEIILTAAETTDEGSILEMEIQMRYNLVASTVETGIPVTEANQNGDQAINAVILEAGLPLTVTKPVQIQVPLPEAFKLSPSASEKDLKVKHIKENGKIYYYNTSISGSGEERTVIFTNPHGFSTFVLETENRTATVQYQMDDGSVQEVVYTATDVGIAELPTDSRFCHYFNGWRFQGDDIIYAPGELTNALFEKLAAAEGTITATPQFTAETVEIMVTKELLDTDGNAKAGNASFYAAAFTAETYTVRYGDPVKLKLENTSQTTAALLVAVPTDGSPITYYIAETDEEGNVVQSGSDFGYQITVTGGEAAVSKGETAAVTITNQLLEQTGTDDPADPTKPGQGGSNEEPGNPTDPTDPTKPGQGGSNEEPGSPTDPSKPTKPGQGDSNEEPGNPTDPTKPADPSKPTDPGQGGTSEDPGKPTTNGSGTANTQSDRAVETGDHAQIFLPFLLCLLALIGIAVRLISKKFHY